MLPRPTVPLPAHPAHPPSAIHKPLDLVAMTFHSCQLTIPTFTTSPFHSVLPSSSSLNKHQLHQHLLVHSIPSITSHRHPIDPTPETAPTTSKDCESRSVEEFRKVEGEYGVLGFQMVVKDQHKKATEQDNHQPVEWRALPSGRGQLWSRRNGYRV